MPTSGLKELKLLVRTISVACEFNFELPKNSRVGPSFVCQLLFDSSYIW